MVLPRQLLVLFAITLGTLGHAAPASEAPGHRVTYPAPGAKDVPPDTPLRLTLNTAPRPGMSGEIRIVEADSGAIVETIDVAAPVKLRTLGGEPNYRYHAFLVAGDEITVTPAPGTLGHGKTYRVEIDPAVTGAPAQPWTFTTRAKPVPGGKTHLVVAADGGGDFATLQGALDYVPTGNTVPTTITLRRGVYREVVFFTDKHALTIRGEDRKATVLEYPNNDWFNPSNGNPFGGTQPNPVAARPGGNIYHRGVFLAHRASDLTVTTLTVRNTTPPGGSQAETIILNGTVDARARLLHLDLFSTQDTLQVNGQAYVEDCYVEGDVDFLWGKGPAFFRDCTFRALRSDAYYTQVRNPQDHHGFVFVHCAFVGAPGVTGNYLSRIGTGRFPHSEVVLVDCTLGAAVHPVGWLYSGGREGNENDPAQVRFWEFNSRDEQGQPVDTSQRRQGSRRLDAKADAEVIRQYRDAGFVLGRWEPGK